MEDFSVLIHLMSPWKDFENHQGIVRRSFEQRIPKRDGNDKKSIRDHIRQGLKSIRQVISNLSGMSLEMAGFTAPGDTDLDFCSLTYTARTVSKS